MSGVSVLRIEQGNQVPDAMQFMGINLSLFGSLFPEELVFPGIGKEWREIIDAYSTDPEVTPASPYVPRVWQLENCKAAEEMEADGCHIEDKDKLFWGTDPAR